jgi:hypothetical protein
MTDIKDLIAERLKVADEKRAKNNARTKTQEEPEQMTREPMTPEQIENWRGVLGRVAMFMTDEQIQAYRDYMQSRVNGMAGHE